MGRVLRYLPVPKSYDAGKVQRNLASMGASADVVRESGGYGSIDVDDAWATAVESRISFLQCADPGDETTGRQRRRTS